jgi:nicotinamidase-related amidase
MNVQLLIIDPQEDFCNPKGSLYVPGAEKDMGRLATLVRRLKDKLDDVHVTLDSHHLVDIAHPIFWVNSAGQHPAPFTIITADDVRQGRWTTYLPSYRQRALEYLEALERGGRYPHCIWPPHCLIGTPGSNIHSALLPALLEWEQQFAIVDKVTKGSNPWTEHFSAVQAEVPDPTDPDTQLNTRLIQVLEQADMVLLAGEASTHCVANTVRDIATAFSDPAYVQKKVLLTDGISPVPDPPGTTLFSDLYRAFLADLTAKGMKTATTVDILT